ncbi:MAG: hypothetical protein KatS3mg131_1408 [Candidatus Tectimicrobiota bacterium]|nr:MAG: hypothetical protein KatS3mg131_1408 [Candidatus Tectomicrobia bacterium]
MTTRLFLASILAAGLLLALPGWTAAQARDGQPAVETIVEKTNCVAYYQGKDGRALVSMVISDAQGRTRQRQFTILRWDDEPAAAPPDSVCGEQKYYVYFHRPADVRRTVFLVWKHVAKDDDRWLYLPALDLVKRIAASDERTSFVGSHFFYEDVSGRSIAEDTHELVQTTDHYYVLRNVPKNPESVEFVAFTMWVHRQSFLPVRVVYYDRQGEPYRVYEALKVDRIQGYPTVTQARMRDQRLGGETVITYERVQYNLGLPESLFSERYLRHPPREYLR